MNKKPIDILNEPEPVALPDADSPLPHENDESTSGMASPKRKIIERASNDLKRGLKDTDRGPEMAKTYRKQKEK